MDNIQMLEYEEIKKKIEINLEIWSRHYGRESSF